MPIFFIQYLLVYISEKFSGFHTMCNPHPNYMHITGYPVQHGDSLHLLWGKHLQCSVNSIPDRKVETCKEQFSQNYMKFFKNVGKKSFESNKTRRKDQFPSELQN